MIRRQSQVHNVTTLQEAIYETVHHGDIPLRRIAEAMGIDPNTLTRYALEGSSGAPMPAFRIAPLVLASKNYLVLDVIERSLNRVAFQLPSVGKPLTKDIAALIIKALKEVSDVFKEVEKSLDNDGQITPDESKRIQWEAFQAIQKILELCAACEGKKS